MPRVQLRAARGDHRLRCDEIRESGKPDVLVDRPSFAVHRFRHLRQCVDKLLRRSARGPAHRIVRNEFRLGDDDVEVHLAVTLRRRKHEKIRDIGTLLLAKPLAVVIEETPRDRTLQADLRLHEIARKHHAEQLVRVVCAAGCLREPGRRKSCSHPV